MELIYGTSLVAQRLKRLPEMQETRVQSLSREDPLEKEMAPHSSILAWRIPWREEPGRPQSMGSQIVRHYWATSLSLFSFMHWRRKWQPTPVFLPGESQGRGSLMGCHLWSHTESDTTEATQQQQQHKSYGVTKADLWIIHYSSEPVLSFIQWKWKPIFLNIHAILQ